jgi:hypothetical protein
VPLFSSDITFKVDEAHERGVYTDLLLSILKKFVALPRLTYLLMPTLLTECVENDPRCGLSCHLRLWTPLPLWNFSHLRQNRLTLLS